MNSTDIQEKNTIIEVTELEQTNTSLEKGPVLLKIGAEWCEECQNIMLILAQVKADYGDRLRLKLIMEIKSLSCPLI
jgi:thioredoxin-like negative regulator of GroEL